MPAETFGSSLRNEGVVHKAKMVQRNRGYYYVGIRLRSDVFGNNQQTLIH